MKFWRTERRRPRGQMEAFRDAIEDCRLADLGFVGPRYTWNNGQENENFVMERLDRAMANVEWHDLFPVHRVDVLAARSSNHALVLLFF